MATKARRLREMAGVLSARLPELSLEAIEDGRRRMGRRWALPTILKSVLLGMMAGCESLAAVELLGGKLSAGIRRCLHLPAMKDTTLRDALVRQTPFEMRQVLRRLVKAAFRRKALGVLPSMPFHAVSMDGKATALPAWDHHYAQQNTHDDGLQSYGLARTISSVLVTSAARVVLDAMPVPAETNETGIFPHAFDALVHHYGQHFELVMYDAGAASQENMAHVVAAGKDFLFCLADKRWRLYQKAESVLGRCTERSVQAQSEQVHSNAETTSRKLYIATAPAGYKDWKHIRTILRVQSQTMKDGVAVSEHNYYLVSSKAPNEITPDQWLALVRSRWAVENNCHWTADSIFGEDKKPWIKADPRAAVVLMVLRRIAYNLLALFRSVSLRSEENRSMPWRELLAWVYDTLIAATIEDVNGLRRRKQPKFACL